MNTTTLKSIRGWFAAALAGLALAGCGGSNDLSEGETTFHVRMMNMMQDSSALQFMLNETALGDTTVNYQSGTVYNAAPPAAYQLRLRALRPPRVSGDTGTTLPMDIGTAVSRTFNAGTDYTLIAAGNMANPEVLVFSGTSLRDQPALTKAVFNVAHALRGGPVVDVYYTAPEAGVTSYTFAGTVAYSAASTPVELTLVRQSGAAATDTLYVDLTLELRATGTATVLYNSGEVRLTERTRTLFAVGPSLSGLGSAVELVSLDLSSAANTLRAPANPGSLRVVHVSDTAPNMDLLRAAGTPQTIVSNLAFGAPPSARVPVPNGQVELAAIPTGNPASFLFLDQFNMQRDFAYSTYAVGVLNVDLDAVSLLDERRVIGNQARFRFLHAASSLRSEPAIDIYFTRTGVPVDFDSTNDTDTTDDAANVRRAQGLTYRGATSYFPLAAGTYDVSITSTGAQTYLLGATTVTLTDGDIRTFVIGSTGTTLTLTAVNDLAN